MPDPMPTERTPPPAVVDQSFAAADPRSSTSPYCAPWRSISSRMCLPARCASESSYEATMMRCVGCLISHQKTNHSTASLVLPTRGGVLSISRSNSSPRSSLASSSPMSVRCERTW